MGKKPKILVAHKKSRYQQIIEFINESKDCERSHDPLQLPPSDLEYLRSSHLIHQKNLDHVIESLQQFDCEFSLQYRGSITSVTDVDLVLCVGGDGTVLDLSHKVSSQPLLGINSNPSRSVGYFCAGISDDVPRLLDEIFSNAILPLSLMRFSVTLNDQRYPLPILNDILVANENPAAVTHYDITIGDLEPENQKSSGIWISTPAGSTAAIRSAGGYIQPLKSRNIQYLVREPCPQPGRSYRHLKGIRSLSHPMSITSRMRSGKLYLDGPHHSIPFQFGDILTLDASTPDLKIYRLSNQFRE